MAQTRVEAWVSGGEQHSVVTEPLNEEETQEHLDQRHATAVEFWKQQFPPDP